MAAEFAQVLIRAKDETKGAFDSASKNMRGLQEDAGRLNGLLGKIGVGVSVAGLASFAKSGIDAADAMNDLSERTGVSVRTLSEWKLAAELADTDLTALAKGVQRLTLSIGQAEAGGKAQAQALQTLGITARDPKQAFEQLAEAVANSNDPIKTNTALNDLLGRSYTELLPLLLGGAKALRESAAASETFAEAMVRLAPDATKLNNSLDLLKSNVAGISADVLSKLLPSFNEWIATGREVVKTGSLLDKVRFFALGNASDEVVGRVRKMAAEAEAAAKKARDAINKVDAPSGGTEPPKKPAGTGTRSDPQAVFVSRLRDEAATLGLSGEALQRYEALKLKLTGTNARLADGYIKQIAAFNDQQAAAKANNALADEEIKKREQLEAAQNNSIKSLREWITEQEFEASLFGKTNAEREAAIQLRALETNGIDIQTESFKTLREQLVAISETRALDSLISDTTIEKTRSLHEKVAILDRALLDGKITTEQWNEAFAKFNGGKKFQELDVFAKRAAENIQDGFADLFKNFDKGTDGMLKSFGESIKGMIAEAAAADLTRWLLGDLVEGGKGSGVAGSLLKKAGSLFDSGMGNGQNLLGDFAEFFGFANGGIAAYGRPVPLSKFAGGGIATSAAIFGEAGPEAAVPLPDGRRIPVEMRGGGNTYVVHVHGANNAPDVRRAAGQGMREAVGMFNQAQRYS